jgi:hypothetical protein
MTSINLNGNEIHSLSDVDDELARLLQGHDISGFANPYRDVPNEGEEGVYSIHQCPKCLSTRRIEEDLAAAGYLKNDAGFFVMCCFDCSDDPQVKWQCPNGCQMAYVLVCGGPSSYDDPDAPNMYFRMRLDGTYTNLFADGTPGVPSDAHEHADGGCCTEPYCPECLSECVQISVKEAV